MRLVLVSVPDEQREAAVDVLRDRDLAYLLTTGAGEQEDRTTVRFVLPADAVEHVLNDLREAGVDSEYTVSTSTEWAQFENVDKIQNRWSNTANRLAPQALRSKAKDLRPNTRSYVLMMVFSAVVAVAGLLANSPAVVVGAMVIAPIVSPALTASVGAVRDDRKMLVESIQQQALGLGVALVAAVAVSLLVKQLAMVPPALDVLSIELVRVRVSPTLLAVVIGLTAGAAATVGLATTGQVSIVGVMIAAALIPTAGVVGISLAWGRPVAAFGAFVLLLLSLLTVNIGSAVTLLYLGYRPDEVDKGLLEFEDRSRVLPVVVTLLAVLLVTGAVGVGTYQQSTFERTVNDGVSDVLDSGAYDQLDVTGIQVEYAIPGPPRGPVTVTLTLGHTGEAPDDLPGAVATELAERTGRPVTVQVQYNDFETATARSGGTLRSESNSSG